MAALDFELLEENSRAAYLLSIALDLEEESQEAILAEAAVLLRREGGFLLALPSGALSADQLQSASEGDPFSVFGANTFITVPAQSLVPGEEVEVLDVLLVDAEVSVRNFMEVLPDPVPESMVMFGSGPDVLPDVSAVMAAAREWISTAAAQVPEMVFYSAAEEVANGEGMSPTRNVGTAPKAGPKPKTKRLTNANIAEKLAEVAGVLPALTMQIDALQRGQEELRVQIHQQSTSPPPRASQMPVSAPLQNFAKLMGSPPRTKAPAVAAKAQMQMPTTTAMVDGEEVDVAMPAGNMLAHAVLQQSKALTSLVSQLQQGGDPLLDGQQTSSGFSLGSRGAQGRERLQQELANRSGGFFLAVFQNMCKRVKPASKLPATLEAAQSMDLSMLSYLEKFGGYGSCRELGLIQYALGHIFDCALNEDLEGVREHIALTMTALEQAAQDNNKWDLAYQLTLLEEPPSQLWSYRPAVTQSRLRAFAPLCSQKWATVALAYAKEVDYIQNRKAEISKPKQPAVDAPAGAPKPKPKRKPKWQGGEPASSGNKQTAEG